MELVKGNSNIQPKRGCEIMSENQPFEIGSTNWRIGRNWGLAHPDHTCYCDGRVVQITTVGTKMVRLGIGYDPKTFIINDYPITYPWMVGYISSIDTFKYGRFEFQFVLPIGQNLWPAIWLTDGKTWPPEIDIVEGWTNEKSLKHPKHAYRKYLWNLIPECCTNKIFPGLVTGNCMENKGGQSYKNIWGGTNAKYLETDFLKANGDPNVCVLEWMPNKITMWYNGHKVMEETDPEMLKWFNASEGMEVHLNNYVSNSFSLDNFLNLPGNDSSCLKIIDFKYLSW